MPRKRKQPDPEVAQATDATPAEPAAAAEPPPDPDAGEQPQRQWAEGPRWSETASLSAERYGPTMAVGRDHKYKQMAIRFTEKPEREVIDALHAGGWTWRGKEKFWTKQLDPGRPATSQRAAEDFFHDLAEGMRARRGLADSPAVG
ncbi:MAG: hypothetical protein C0501_26485 [Isosphaera sp.]|nr:hypothetical protein [Isosphaera sp.]